MADIDLIDAMDAAGRAFERAQSDLYKALGIDVVYVERHEGRVWGIDGHVLLLRHDDGVWGYECELDPVPGKLTHEVSATLSAVVEGDDEGGNRLHLLTTALRDDAGAVRSRRGEP